MSEQNHYHVCIFCPFTSEEKFEVWEHLERRHGLEDELHLAMCTHKMTRFITATEMARREIANLMWIQQTEILITRLVRLGG